MMFRSLRLFLLLACVACPEVVGDTRKTPTCDKGWMGYRDNCYTYIGKQMKWSHAERECQTYGNKAHLASIHNPEEANFISNYLMARSGYSHVWIGLYFSQRRKSWRWSDGSHAWYNQWSKSLSDMDERGYCAELSYSNKFLKWKKNSCSELKHLVCKYRL